MLLKNPDESLNGSGQEPILLLHIFEEGEICKTCLSLLVKL